MAPYAANRSGVGSLLSTCASLISVFVAMRNFGLPGGFSVFLRGQCRAFFLLVRTYVSFTAARSNRPSVPRPQRWSGSFSIFRVLSAVLKIPHTRVVTR